MEMTQKQKKNNRNRFIITSVILITFLFIMIGIGYAILSEGDTPSFSQEWKEILLLVLGAFIGSYSKVIDFWFNGRDDDPVVPPAEVTPDDIPNFCSNCGVDNDPTDNF